MQILELTITTSSSINNFSNAGSADVGLDIDARSSETSLPTCYDWNADYRKHTSVQSQKH